MCARPIVDFVHPEDIQHTIDEISRQSKGYSTLAFENRYLCKNGEYKYLSWKSVPVGSLLYATARDMTEFKKDKLRLIHADRMVAVGTLAAGIGHEINNPLAYTLANLSLIAEELEKKEILNNPNALVSAREKISRCLEGVNRVKDVMRGLKLFSKNDGDTVEPLDLATVMDSSLRMAMHEIQPRAQIVKEYAAVPLVDGNESQIGQVFLNLLINAAHSIREGNPGSNSITLIIGADGEKVFVRVKDTGSGISDEVLPRIFEAFFTTKAGDVGTGLGLSICEKIVTSYNGSITVASQVGEGTCFTVSFPKSSLKAPIRHREKIDSKSSKPRFRILVVDDEPSLTEAIVSTIGEGHDTKALNNGKEARDHLLENPHYDLILCDLMMPGFSGMNLHEALKLDGRGLERKIIFMTGGAYTPETVRFLREAENEYLEKPFELKTIRELVMKLS
jgi:signal transduction histidine kinase/CheY-like chemotaxis protein